jgi:hypothetical protein
MSIVKECCLSTDDEEKVSIKGRDLLVFSLHFDEDAMPTFTIQSW